MYKMMPEGKLNAVRNYLKSEFPGYDLADQYDPDRIAQTFRLTTKDQIRLVTFSREFLDDHNASDISKNLGKLQLARYFQQKNMARTIVTNYGMRFE
jgi:hypothetical protein